MEGGMADNQHCQCWAGEGDIHVSDEQGARKLGRARALECHSTRYVHVYLCMLLVDRDMHSL